MPKLAALLSVLALAVFAAPLPAAATGSHQAHAAKKCKKGKKHCKKKPGKKPAANPFTAGQPCSPSQASTYAKYGFLCLPQPRPDGTTENQLVPSQA